MAAAAAAISFADEPVADVKVAEFTGNAAVTWGVDLDTQKTGFKNEESATLKVNISNEGTKKTEGEGIWAEIEIKGKQLYVKNGGADTGTLKTGKDQGSTYGVTIDGDTTRYTTWKWESNNASFDGSGGASVEKAQLHFGPVYVGIKSGDTVLGEFGPQNAVFSSNLKIDNVAGTKREQGIVAGYTSDLFDIAFDFRSNKDDDNYYTNDYGLAGEATLKFVPGLEIKAGADYQIGVDGKADKNSLGIGASAKYSLALGEKFKLIPSVGYTMAYKDDNDANTNDAKMNMAAGVIFSWGAEADANAGVPYLDGDYAKKVTPGVGVAVKIADLQKFDANDRGITIVPSFYSGDLIPNLTAAVLGEIDVPTKTDVKPNFGVAGGLKYKLAINDSVTITPYAGLRFVHGAGLGAFTNNNGDNGNKKDLAAEGKDGNKLNVKVGADVSGLINNTTFSAWWQSRNLVNDEADKTTNGQVGTINIQCKIAL